MKRLAARDYEDLLQCAIPAFAGLLPEEHDSVVLFLLFELSTWHSLAKLRLHSESTLKELRKSGKRLGEALRTFRDEVCSKYHTVELVASEGTRTRKKTRRRDSDADKGKVISFNMETYKLHALLDYPEVIERLGTTDNYSTQIVSLARIPWILVNPSSPS